MEYKLKRKEIWGFFITSAAAVLFHFLYEILPNPIIGMISPVNESVWEHIKIIFYPYLFWAIIEYLTSKSIDKRQFIISKAYGLSALPIMLLVFNYTYSGILGRNITAIDISGTFVYLLIAFIISYNGYKKRWSKLSTPTEIICIVFIAALILFTFIPPHLPPFWDKAKAIYGIPQ